MMKHPEEALGSKKPGNSNKHPFSTKNIAKATIFSKKCEALWVMYVTGTRGRRLLYIKLMKCYRSPCLCQTSMARVRNTKTNEIPLPQTGVWNVSEKRNTRVCVSNFHLEFERGGDFCGRRVPKWTSVRFLAANLNFLSLYCKFCYWFLFPENQEIKRIFSILEKGRSEICFQAGKLCARASWNRGSRKWPTSFSGFLAGISWAKVGPRGYSL